MAVILLAATTSAANSSEFRIRTNSDKVTFGATPALAGAEEVDLEQTFNGTTWHKVSIGALDATTFAAVLSAPGRYRLQKDSTAGATALFLEGKCKLL